MQSTNERIFDDILALVPDLRDLRPGDYRMFRATGLMDLHLDTLDVRECGGEVEMRIALAHNYRHPSGDTIPDPDMEIRICPERRFAEAMSYQDTYAYRIVYDESGRADLGEWKSQNDFLLTWLRNIRCQGYALAEKRGGGG